MSRVLLAACALVVSSLQAWDSHALDASLGVQALIFGGVVLPAAALLLTRDVLIRGGAVLAAAILMVAARAISATPMPGLALAAFFPGILVLLDHIRTLNASRGPSLASGQRKG